MARSPAVLVAALALQLACSTTQGTEESSGSASLVSAPQSFGSVIVRYSETLPPDRAARAAENNVAQRIQAETLDWLRSADLVGGEVSVDLEITQFRLPDGGTRWMTGSFKGSDYLACSVAVRQPDGALLGSGRVRTELGSLDRSVGENYSADFALQNMIDNLSWRVAFELTAPGHDQKVLAAAKEKGVVPAIQELGSRGELTYSEVLKYSALGTFRGDSSVVLCASSLSKPAWMPAFIWDFPLIGLHSSCLATAEEHKSRARAAP